MSNWQKAIDKFLVARELGIADDKDSFEECERKLNMLLDYEIDVNEYFRDGKVILWECVGCLHLYQDAPRSCDCLDNPNGIYNEFVAYPKIDKDTP